MKLQAAIDRVSLERAKEFVRDLDGEADIIEMGTSLTMEFGVRALAPLVELSKGTPMLGDIKTMDEGRYEFDTTFESGFTYVTVMGAASDGTIKVCHESTVEHGGQMMIDLLGCSDERIREVGIYPDAIYYLHTSIDMPQPDPLEEIRSFKRRFPHLTRLAISADGFLDELPALAAEGVEILIMGPTIHQADDPKAACRAVKAAMR